MGGSSRVCSIHTLTNNENIFSHCSLMVEHYMRESTISDEVEQLKKKIESDQSIMEELLKEVSILWIIKVSKASYILSSPS